MNGFRALFSHIRRWGPVDAETKVVGVVGGQSTWAKNSGFYYGDQPSTLYLYDIKADLWTVSWAKRRTESGSEGGRTRSKSTYV